MSEWEETVCRWCLESLDYGLLSTDSELKIRSWNPWLEVHSGYRADEVIGRSLLELYPDLRDRGMDRFYRQALQGETVILSQRFHKFLLPFPARPKSGFEKMPQNARISGLVSGDTVIGTVTFIEDVTDNLVWEQKMKDQLLEREVFSNMEGSILCLDVDQCLQHLVNAMKDLLRCHVGAVLVGDAPDSLELKAFYGRDCEQQDPELAEKSVAKAVWSGRDILLKDVTRARADTRVDPLCPTSRSVVAVPIVLENSVIGSLVCESRSPESFDNNSLELLKRLARQTAIALRSARLLAALHESEMRYRTLVESAPLGVSLIQNDRFIYVNPVLCEMSGYSCEELLSEMAPLELVLPEDRNLLLESFRQRLSGEEPFGHYELRGVQKDGSIRYVEIYSNRVTYKGKPAAMSIIVDITERKAIEEEQNRLRAAIEQAAESVIITDRDFTILYVNPAFERISGYTRGEVVGCSSGDLLCSAHYDRVFCNEIKKVLDSGKVWTGSLTKERKDGSHYEVEGSISPVRNKAGEIINYVMVERDVTHEVMLEQQLRQAQKLEAIGTMAGGIAHDFNNILGVILGYTELAMLDVPEHSRTAESLKEVLSATERAKDLVRQILTLSRRDKPQKTTILVAPVVKEVLKLLRAALPSTIEIKWKILDGEAAIYGDLTQIHQVLMNLCNNAAYAMREKGGVMEIVLESVVIDAGQARYLADISPGKYVRLTVKDTGHGMSASIQERIFDPYFTTKPMGEGTGLGLAIVHGIVRSHHGTITVESEPGKGTTFQVLLPQVEWDASQNVEVVQDAVVGGTERILFVDDEASLAEMNGQILRHYGYQVTVLTSSEEALKLFGEDPGRFDLVITDQTMPKMTGKELALAMLKIRPDIPIILCTGYSDLVNETEAERLGISAFLMKPIDAHKLAVTVRRVLDQAGLSQSTG